MTAPVPERLRILGVRGLRHSIDTAPGRDPTIGQIAEGTIAPVLADLRTQVQQLRAVPPIESVAGHRFSDDSLVWRSDVLALLDGGKQ